MRKTNTVMFTKYLVDFLSIALKQTKAGPRSSGTHVLVINLFICNLTHFNLCLATAIHNFYSG